MESIMAEDVRNENAPETPNEAQDAPETQEPQLPSNDVQVEDLGESRRKITITVPRARIDAKFNELYGELENTAVIAGFRKGHAPRRLVEKRFGRDVADDVRNSLVSESLLAAVKDEELEILGDPDLKLEDITLPDTGDLSFSVEVEVKPQFDLPDYNGIPVTRQSAEITPERVAETTANFLRSRGTVVPVEGAAQAGDIVVADVKLTGDGIEEHVHEGQELRVAAGALEGVPLENLGEQLAGVTSGATVTVEAVVPEGHPQEAWRGKAAKFELSVREIKRLEVPELTDELAGELGFETAEEFRNYVRGSLERRVQIESQQAMREQVGRWLLEHTQLDVPPGLAARHSREVFRRRYMNLLYSGVPQEQIDQNVELLQAQANQQARNDLKLEFVLGKIAEALSVEVDEGEVNARIAAMASQYGRRPERLRSELTADGSIEQLIGQIRDEKTMDRVLEMANVGEPAPGEQA